MNNKGQALIEFVLILPIFLLILLSVVDFGKIINAKNMIENKSIDIVEMIKNNKTLEEIKSKYDEDIEINIKYEGEYIKVIISKEIDIMTPGLNKILKDQNIVKVERIIYNE